jgi:hypothetical protein
MISTMPVIRYGPSLQLPTRYRDKHGTERIAGRRCAMQIDGHVYCPNQHRIRYDRGTVLTENVYRCRHKLSDGTSECGTLLYVIAYFEQHGQDFLWAAEVTADEIRRMRHMRLSDKLEYLEVTWAGIG